MKIPQFDLTRQYEQIEPEIESAVRHVLRSGQFILGPEGEAFEAECAAYLGVSHAIGLGSGSDAIKLALRALGVGPGTEVVTPAFSFVASATAALELGARPVFVDVEPATLTLDPDRVAAAITPETRVILAVHLYGLPAAMGPLRVLADAHGIHLVEDAAQAFGATLGGRPVGRPRPGGGVQLLPHEEPRGLRRRRSGDDDRRDARRAPAPGPEPRADAGSTSTPSSGGPRGWTSCRRPSSA